MNLIESVKMSLDSIFANKMRSFLTMLGIIIGIAAVIAILAVGNGATTRITGTFNNLGASTISLSTTQDIPDNQKITEKDLQAIRNGISEVERISPDVTTTAQIATADKSKVVLIMGGSSDLQYTNQIMDETIIYGRYFNDSEYSEEKNVAVVSADTARSMFNGQENVVGEKVSLTTTNGQVTVKIIGVTKSMFDQMIGSFSSEDMPAYLAMPLSTMGELAPQATKITSAVVRVQRKDDIESVSKQIVMILETRHDAIGDNYFVARNFLQALDQVDNVLTLFINFIAIVAGIALLVGGIGVMNIMLVSVTERTREIGTRKALGATNGNILIQFLMESVILCLIGGLIGLALGIALSLGVSSALDIVPAFSISSVVFVLVFSSAIGIFFGVYPARKASMLDPIEALRYE